MSKMNLDDKDISFLTNESHLAYIELMKKESGKPSKSF